MTNIYELIKQTAFLLEVEKGELKRLTSIQDHLEWIERYNSPDYPMKGLILYATAKRTQLLTALDYNPDQNLDNAVSLARLDITKYTEIKKLLFEYAWWNNDLVVPGLDLAVKHRKKSKAIIKLKKMLGKLGFDTSQLEA